MRTDGRTDIHDELCMKHQLDAQIIIYSYNVTIPPHVSSNRCPPSGGHIVYTQPMVFVTL
jgi:hypothetical protein